MSNLIYLNHPEKEKAKGKKTIVGEMNKKSLPITIMGYSIGPNSTLRNRGNPKIKMSKFGPQKKKFKVLWL